MTYYLVLVQLQFLRGNYEDQEISNEPV